MYRHRRVYEHDYSIRRSQVTVVLKVSSLSGAVEGDTHFGPNLRSTGPPSLYRRNWRSRGDHRPSFDEPRGTECVGVCGV